VSTVSQRISVASRLDRVPLSGYHHKILGIIALGEWFDMYDLYMISYVAAALLSTHFLSPSQFTAYISAGFVGMFVGCIILGWLGDRFGRRTLFTFNLLWYSIFTILGALSPNATLMIVARALAGLGMGAEFIIVDTYLGEMIPAKARGRYIIYAYTIAFTAAPIVAFLSYFIVPHTWGLPGWRWIMLIGGIGALAVWPIRLALPETPRWLESKGRTAEADALVTQIENDIQRASSQPLPPVTQDVTVPVSAGVPISELVHRPYGGRMGMMMLLQFLQSIAYFGFASWAPTFLLKEGFSLVHALFYTALIALFIPIGSLIGALLAERFERKWQIAILSLAIAAVGLAFSLAHVPWLIVVTGAALSLLNNWFSPAIHAYQAEIFPTRLRSTAGGFAYSWSRLSAAISAFVIAAVLFGWGVFGVFVVISAFMVIIAAEMIWAPKTNERPLEEIAS